MNMTKFALAGGSGASVNIQYLREVIIMNIFKLVEHSGDHYKVIEERNKSRLNNSII